MLGHERVRGVEVFSGLGLTRDPPVLVSQQRNRNSRGFGWGGILFTLLELWSSADWGACNFEGPGPGLAEALCTNAEKLKGPFGGRSVGVLRFFWVVLGFGEVLLRDHAAGFGGCGVWGFRWWLCGWMGLSVYQPRCAGPEFQGAFTRTPPPKRHMSEAGAL